MPAVDRKGNPVALNDASQVRMVHFMYDTLPGRLVMRVLTRPWLSRIAGAYLDTRFSKRLIPGFIQKNGIDLSDYEKKEYATFNEFFCRRVLPGARPVEGGENVFVSPADSKLTVLPVTENAKFSIKNISYTFEELVRDKALAGRFAGGTMMIFRLTVSDYHRYGYPCTGIQRTHRRICGHYHTVHPLAAEKTPLYAENTREYCLIETERFGTVLMMEVGALLVGRIVNNSTEGPAERGKEKGHFEYGGSTVICCTEKGKLNVDAEFTANSTNGFETCVKYGERIGACCE